VLVLGETPDRSRRAQLAKVEPGKRFAFQGRVYETLGEHHVERVLATGEVLGRVVNTFTRMAPEVIDVEIAFGDGTKDVLAGTPNHPFWVDAVRDYVPLGGLEVGAALHVQGGGEAILVSKTWRLGDFEVFDFEVEGLHNFYVRGEGSDASGVLVHNSASLNESLARQTLGKPANSRVLGANLVADGVNRPANTAAHHIVAGNSPAAREAREVLAQEGIDINEAANGVFLPTNTANAAPPAATHSTLHTNAYYGKVNELITSAESGTVREVLADIATQLQEGKF